MPSFSTVCCAFLLLTLVECRSPDLPNLVSATECHRFSLEALAYQTYLPKAQRALQDLSSFASSALDSTLDSVQHLMTILPGKDKSDSQDVQVRTSFHRLKSSVLQVIKKSERNVTQSWEGVLQANLRFLNRTEKSPQVLLEAARRLSDTYENAGNAILRKVAEAILEPLKQLLKSSAQSLEQMKQGPSILAEFMPNLLGRLTKLALDLNLNLEEPVKVPDLPGLTLKSRSEDWEQFLAAAHFDVRLLVAELQTLLSERRSSGPEKLELTRRDLFMHWSHLAYGVLAAAHKDDQSKDNEEQRESGRGPQLSKEPGNSRQTLLENRLISLIQTFA